jgi:group I intron endonuclease
VQDSGVYKITNVVNGKVYVGSSARELLRRIRGHLKDLNSGKHRNRHLQSAWNKYGKSKFVFSILERCAPNDCLTREQCWINLLKSSDQRYGYNLCPTAGSMYGYRHTEESKKKMADTQNRKLQDPNELARRKEVMNHPEVKARISASHKGKIISQSARQNMSKAISAAMTPELRNAFYGELPRNNGVTPKLWPSEASKPETSGLQ